MKYLKRIFCKHEYIFIRKLYGDEINDHNGKRYEYKCSKCGAYEWLMKGGVE